MQQARQREWWTDAPAPPAPSFPTCDGVFHDHDLGDKEQHVKHQHLRPVLLVLCQVLLRGGELLWADDHLGGEEQEGPAGQDEGQGEVGQAKHPGIPHEKSSFRSRELA